MWHNIKNGGGAALIAVGEQVEEQLAAGGVEGNEPQFVDDQQRRPLVALVQPGEGSLVPAGGASSRC